MYRPLSGTPLEDLLARARKTAEDTLQMVLTSSESFRLATCPTKQRVIQAFTDWITAAQQLVADMAESRAGLSDEAKLALDAAISQVNASIKVCQTTLEGMKQAYARECPSAASSVSAGGNAMDYAAIAALGVVAYFVLRRK